MKSTFLVYSLSLLALLLSISHGSKVEEELQHWRYPLHKSPEEFQAKVNRFAAQDSAQCLVLAGSDAGLANRLRVLFAYKIVARTVYNCAQLVFEWEVNEACPGHFLSVFEPLPNVTFISAAQRAILAPIARAVFNNSRETFSEALLRNDVNFYLKKRGFFSVEMALYEQLVPVSEIRETVSEWAGQHALCNTSAMHIRKTDLEQTLFHKRRTAIESFYRWVEALPANETVFLSTDNPTTQRDFIDRYGWGKILVYRNISDTEHSVSLSPHKAINCNDNDTTSCLPEKQKPPQGDSSAVEEKRPSERRFTGLRHAVVDVFLAAHHRQFRFSTFSSFSELIKTVNFLHRWEWCGCGHRGCRT